MTHTCCPVCDFELGFAPWDGESPSDEICPSCGIQFGYNDSRSDIRNYVYAEWRAAWLQNKRQPFNGQEWHEVSARLGHNALAKLKTG